MATVQLSGALRAAVSKTMPDSQALELDGKDVREILNQLTLQSEEARKQIFNREDCLNNFVSIFVDQKDIRLAEGLDTKLTPKSKVTILVAIAGG